MSYYLAKYNKCQSMALYQKYWESVQLSFSLLAYTKKKSKGSGDTIRLKNKHLQSSHKSWPMCQSGRDVISNYRFFACMNGWLTKKIYKCATVFVNKNFQNDSHLDTKFINIWGDFQRKISLWSLHKGFCIQDSRLSFWKWYIMR